MCVTTDESADEIDSHCLSITNHNSLGCEQAHCTVRKDVKAVLPLN